MTDPEIHAEQATNRNRELGGKWMPLVKDGEALEPIRREGKWQIRS